MGLTCEMGNRKKTALIEEKITVWKIFRPSNIGEERNMKRKEHTGAAQGDFVNRCFTTEKTGGQEQHATRSIFY